MVALLVVGVIVTAGVVSLTGREPVAVVTLLGAMKKRDAKRGVASLCIGGGEATAMAIEML